MRSAITYAQSHTGEEFLLFGWNTSIQEQKAYIRNNFLGKRTHEEYKLVVYQESDQSCVKYNFAKPEQSQVDNKENRKQEQKKGKRNE